MRKLKREVPKDYTFLDLTAPSYSKVKITPKFDGGGTYSDDDWIRKILNFEATKGSATGTGLSNWGYNNWQKWGHTSAPTSLDQAVDYFKQDYLPQVSQYPMGLRERMADYLYNTGRNPNDLLLYNAGKITLDQLNSSNVFTNEWNQYGPEIQKMYSDPNFISNLDTNKSNVYRTTGGYSLGNPNPIYDTSWKYRVGMFDAPKQVAPQSNPVNNPVINDGTQPIIGSVQTTNDLSKAREGKTNIPLLTPPAVNIPENTSQINTGNALPTTFGSNQWGTPQSGFISPSTYADPTQSIVGNLNYQNQIGSVTTGSTELYDLYNNNSTLFNQNQPISNNQQVSLPAKPDPYGINEWKLPEIPAGAQRPSDYAPVPKIETKTESETPDNTDTSNSYAYYGFDPFTTSLNFLNAGLNTVGGMRNMSRIKKQENLNSFITQQPEAIYPNKRMLYGDKSMFAEHGGEFIKYEGGGSWTDYLNPMNWGVEDYSEYSKFSNAYRTAKSNGKEEFLWNGKRYNTKYAGTPRQEVGMYGANGKKVTTKQIDNPYLVNYYTPKLGYYLPGHIEVANKEGYAVNNSRTGNSSFGIDPGYEPHKGKSSYLVYGPDSTRFRNTVSSLPMGDYQYLFEEEELKHNKFNTGKSTWNLLTNNCADGVCDAFGIPKSGKVTHPSATLNKISNKYPTVNITGRDRESYENKIKEYVKGDKNSILKQSEYYLGIVNSPEFVNSNTSYRKKVIGAIQDSLHKSGYSLPNSQKADGSFDGVIGPETQAALQKYHQQTSKKKEHGGEYQEGGSVDLSQLVEYKKGGIYIKPENKGKFTAWAQSHGMSVQEAASHVMANKEKYSSTIVKRANFAKNASKFKHEEGGEYAMGGSTPPWFKPSTSWPRATASDSLNVYNQSLALQKFYKDNHYQKLSKSITPIGSSYLQDAVTLFKDTNKSGIKTLDKNSRGLGSVRDYKTEVLPFNKYYMDLNPYQFLQRESASKYLNMDAPMGFYDRRIQPTQIVKYRGDKDMVEIPSYDPISVKPYAMLTPAERQMRQLMYGKPKPTSKPKPKVATTTKPVTKKTVTPVTPPAPVTTTIQAPNKEVPVKRYKTLVANAAMTPQYKTGTPIVQLENGLFYNMDEFNKIKESYKGKYRYEEKMNYGGQYSYGGHYIPQDVNYIGGTFVPNPIDLQEFMKGGQMIKRADGSYSKRGLWDNIRANKGSGKKPTKEMLKQERKIKKNYKAGGEYMEGNEYEISGEELDRLRSLGYDVEMI